MDVQENLFKLFQADFVIHLAYYVYDMQTADLLLSWGKLLLAHLLLTSLSEGEFGLKCTVSQCFPTGQDFHKQL